MIATIEFNEINSAGNGFLRATYTNAGWACESPVMLKFLNTLMPIRGIPGYDPVPNNGVVKFMAPLVGARVVEEEEPDLDKSDASVVY